jgi:hypothetical protein
MAFSDFLQAHLSNDVLLHEDINQLYGKYSIENFDLQDQGYITKVHPLELWLVGYLAKHPNASREQVIAASGKERVEVYRWLFSNHRKTTHHVLIGSRSL